MLFVDGENLAMRVQSLAKSRGVSLIQDVVHERDVFVWRQALGNVRQHTGIIRRHYYTSMQGDAPKLLDAEKRLKSAGIEAPHVFPKKSGRSKRVDITLATDMLLHACRKHFDIAILVAGDEDYVPLVQAVQREGALVYVWFVPDGLSDHLAHAADRYSDISEFLCGG